MVGARSAGTNRAIRKQKQIVGTVTPKIAVPRSMAGNGDISRRLAMANPITEITHHEQRFPTEMKSKYCR